MSQVHINWEQAELVFGRLLEAFRNNQYPYDFAKVPQRREVMPRNLTWGSYEHALFLFCSCYYMRGTIKSDRAIVALAKLYSRRPELFLPTYSISLERSIHSFIREITYELQSEGLGYQADRIAEWWVLNFQKLMRFWSGDPRLFYQNTTSYEDMCAILIRKNKKFNPDVKDGFLGFREKMTSMLTYFFMYAGIIPEFVFPVPVDFHIMRTLVSHGVLITEGQDIGHDVLTPELQQAARTLTYEYCVRHRVDTITLGDTMWLLSGNLCNLHPGNGTKRPKENEGRKTKVEPIPVTWKPSQVERFQRACVHCPIKSTCQYQIPAGNYYVQGILTIRGKRLIPPQHFLEYA